MCTDEGEMKGEGGCPGPAGCGKGNEGEIH